MDIYLSVVIPAYNEEARIGATLGAIIHYLKKQRYDSEIIVSDDGSKDQTVSVAREKLRGFPHQVLLAPENQGKGSAVRRGMLSAKGEYVLFTDADLSTPIEEVKKFIEFHEQNNYDVIIGSRALPESNVEIHQDWKRELMGRVFNFFVSLLAFRGILDSQCGFKSFNRNAAKELFSNQKLEGFSFDVEIIYLAKQSGYKVLEAPVTWRNSTQTRVRLFKDPILMFWDLLKIRWLHRNHVPN